MRSRVEVGETDGEIRSLQDRILEGSAQLISRKGFHGAVAQDLADVAGLVKGTLYYHIHSKDELLFQIHQQVTEEGIRTWSAIAYKDASPTALIEEMIIAHCRVMDGYRDSIAVMSEEMKYLSPERLKKVIERRDLYSSLLEGVVARGIRSGEFRPFDQRISTLIILGMLNGMYRWYRAGGDLTPEEIGRIFSSLLFDGLLAPASSAA
jgi:TetR/AcrR family transcriptional regulator, cholesterol catabolism regulator